MKENPLVFLLHLYQMSLPLTYADSKFHTKVTLVQWWS